MLVAMRYGCHYSHCRRCDGRAGQSRRHDQEGGVSIGGEAGPRRGREDPAIQTVAPDLPLDVLRNMDIRVDPVDLQLVVPEYRKKTLGLS